MVALSSCVMSASKSIKCQPSPNSYRCASPIQPEDLLSDVALLYYSSVADQETICSISKVTTKILSMREATYPSGDNGSHQLEEVRNCETEGKAAEWP